MRNDEHAPGLTPVLAVGLSPRLADSVSTDRGVFAATGSWRTHDMSYLNGLIPR